MSCLHDKIRKYLINKELRYYSFYSTPVALAALVGFSVLMLSAARKTGSATIACCIIAAFSLFIVLNQILAIRKYFWVLNIRYLCTDHQVVNWSRKQTRTLDINESFYCTKILIPFYWGKTHSEEYFYVLSSSPLYDLVKKRGGLVVIYHIWERGALLLPYTNEVNQWICRINSTKEIAQYPSVMYFPK